ncbi:hypothetical protein [Pseudarthrobacter niigatensis]|uniref:Uncharacterized protein n=1 Tax=Pseudarthrobacter niigatensis TaxID=369935 RepID=A0AAJ1SZA3_9MICC|nr:hypothetical protein [Pseudarthrobacter niigatensis]MDQ0147336.1 hypothetical protein [Pseudarthrobacter niigatensis]MDQ0267153.1 hypothetical protein [Pseudarthrobacter niigatensis]
MADPALGPVRTMRQHLIVAATVNAVCAGLPGAPKVNALKDGWLMTGAAGASAQCQTLDELWSAVLGCFQDPAVLGRLMRRRLAYAADPANAGLPARAAGLPPDPEHYQGDFA